MITESRVKIIKEAPPSIILRLVSVQTFPNEQKVALYFCEQIKKYFSFTYGKNGLLAEEELSGEVFDIDFLQKIEGIQTIFFEDESSLNVNEECSRQILDLYDNISEGKEEFLQYIKQSNSNFLKVLDYSVNNFNKET